MELGVEAAAHHSNPQSFRHSILVMDAEFLQCFRWAALPLRDKRVALIIEIGDADFARPEPRRRHVAEHVEERDALAHLRPRLLGPGNVIDQGRLFTWSRRDERLAEPLGALVVQPGESAAHRRLTVGPVVQHEVHVLGHAGVGGTSRALVTRDDEVHEDPYRLPLVGREERGRERRLRLQRVPGKRCRPCRLCRRPFKCRRQRGHRHCAYRFAPPHSALFLSWSAMYSDVRHDSAMIVQVGFLSACDVNGAPSATKRFLTSCVWQLLFTTEVLGSAPMRAPPSSWMMTPPAAMP